MSSCKGIVRAACIGVLGVLLLGTVPQALAIIPHRKSTAEKAEKKEEKTEKKDAKKMAEQDKVYNNITEYAEHLYSSDPDFRQQVDDAYKERQRQDALRAFRVNTRPLLTTIVTPEGDFLGLRKVLYGDLRVQDYVNHLGQSLVPPDSNRLYVFRVIRSPIPIADALSTGTIYISTGLISLTDNEAQLAYILSHEIGHVYYDHWKSKIMVERAVPRYEARQYKKHALYGAMIGAGLGAALGGAIGQSGAAAAQGVGAGALLGVLGSAGLTAFQERKLNTDWTLPQEDQADAFALKNALKQNYDVKEVPKLYLVLKDADTADSRVGLGFVADGRRIQDRLKCVNDQLATTYKTDYETKLKAAKLVGTGPDYELMMAQLKRDNGIMALKFDMLNMARENLDQAVSLRSDDPIALYYDGKINKLVARTEKQRQAADNETLRAIKLDKARDLLPEAELQHALILMEKTDPQNEEEAVQALKSYVSEYQEAQVAGWKYFSALPPDMPFVYDYLRLLGDPTWKPNFPQLQRVLTADYGKSGRTASLAPVATTANREAPMRSIDRRR